MELRPCKKPFLISQEYSCKTLLFFKILKDSARSYDLQVMTENMVDIRISYFFYHLHLIKPIAVTFSIEIFSM